jgi:hypothetical protein
MILDCGTSTVEFSVLRPFFDRPEVYSGLWSILSNEESDRSKTLVGKLLISGGTHEYSARHANVTNLSKR